MNPPMPGFVDRLRLAARTLGYGLLLVGLVLAIILSVYSAFVSMDRGDQPHGPDPIFPMPR